MDACAVVGLLRRREVSPAELVEAALSRISVTEPAINAMPTLCPDRARAAAEGADPASLLAGLPIGIKDLTPVAGLRTTFGTPGLADFVPDTSDPLVEQLESRGAVVLGKTNTPEMGAGGNTFNRVFGTTRNPWDTRLNAGGSSGGSAAALATGEIWLSHGSDHGGSLRTPAAYCGIVGLRPGFGRVAGGGLDNIYLPESVQGPMARSVRDCALFLDAMVGHDPRYPVSLPAGESFLAAADRAADAPPLRIAFAPDMGGISPVEPEMAAHLADVMATLARDGARVEETCPDLTGLEPTYHTLRGMFWAITVRRMPAHIPAQFKPVLAQNAAFGQALTMDRIADAMLDRSRLHQAMTALFRHFDLLACPVVGCMPHPHSEEWVAEIAGVQLTGYMDWLRFSFLATVTGLPAISVPVGLGPRGLPVGLQLIGRPQGEAALLAAAQRVEWVMGGPLGPIDPA
jgi:amidase